MKIYNVNGYEHKVKVIHRDNSIFETFGLTNLVVRTSTIIDNKKYESIYTGVYDKLKERKELLLVAIEYNKNKLKKYESKKLVA